MKTKLWQQKTLMAVVLVAMAAGAQAQQGMGRGGMHNPMQPMQNMGDCVWGNGNNNAQSGAMWSQLNLSVEQQQKIQALQIQQQKMQMNQQDINAWQAHHQQVQALIASDKFDGKAANKLAREFQNGRINRMVGAWKMQNEFYNVLTPEQKQVWKTRRQNMGSCMY